MKRGGGERPVLLLADVWACLKKGDAVEERSGLESRRRDGACGDYNNGTKRGKEYVEGREPCGEDRHRPLAAAIALQAIEAPILSASVTVETVRSGKTSGRTCFSSSCQCLLGGIEVSASAMTHGRASWGVCLTSL